MAEDAPTTMDAGGPVGLDAVVARMQRLRPLIDNVREERAVNEREYDEIVARERGYVAEYEHLRQKAGSLLDALEARDAA